MNNIISFGELLWDIYEKDEFIGGAPFNFAAHTVKQGLKTALITAVGNDALGEKSIKMLNKLNVDTCFIQKKEGFSTGKTLVTFKDNFPQYDVLNHVAFDRIEITDNDIKKINFLKPVCFYFGSLIQRSKISDDSLKKILKECTFKIIFSDINIRAGSTRPEAVKFCLEHCDIVKISREELPNLSDYGILPQYTNIQEASRMLSEKYNNLKKIIITLDIDGAYGYNCEKDIEYSVPAYPCTPVSSVGAGDSFSATFIASLIKGIDFENCLKNAAKIASFVVASPQAVPNYNNDLLNF